jgi:hypothetical protein
MVAEAQKQYLFRPKRSSVKKILFVEEKAVQ